jgi:hypothetical protein
MQEPFDQPGRNSAPVIVALACELPELISLHALQREWLARQAHDCTAVAVRRGVAVSG